MLISARVKEIRKMKKFSQEELGEKLGVTKVSICGYETGSRIPSLDTFELLADVLEVSTDYLLGREKSIVSESSNSYIGAVSERDIAIIKELKRNPDLYRKFSEDPKRIVARLNKKI